MRKKNPAARQAAAAAIPFILVAAAHAQAPPQSTGPDSSLEEVTVTGSRISRPNGFSAPTPVTVVGADRLEQRAIANIGDALNELPSFRASTNPATQQSTGGSIGARVLDLRGLGAPRTLVLVDGKRFVASTSQGTIDTNLIPSILIDRVDIVTGGASAAYGSDAVAGVVNFALDGKLEGMKASGSYGESAEGDDENYNASLAGGLSFAGGRGHFVAAGEFSKEHGLGDCYTRSWCGSSVLNLGNSPPGSGGRPANNITDNVQTATYAQDGVIDSAVASFPLRGISFTPAGTPRPFQYGELYGTNLAPLFMKGGEGQGENTFIAGYLLKAPVSRYIGYTKTTFDFTDTVTGGLDLSYGQVDGQAYGAQYRDSAGSLSNAQSFGAIKSGNPYLPASVQQTMTANNIATFVLGRAFGDIGNALAESTTKTYRAVASLDGKFGDSGWKWDGYYQFGKNDVRLDVDNNISISRMRNAIDATTNGAGQIVCRINADATTANDDPSCAPFNPFGRDRFSAESLAYVTPHGFQTTSIRENVAAANTQGDLFSLPAGAVQLAGGVEWRSQKLTGDADSISKGDPALIAPTALPGSTPPPGFYSFNGQSLAGKIEVKEAYLETNIPLLKDVPFAKALELNGAARRTHYSTNGAGTDNSLSVTTWKAGATWEVIPEVRFRATRSRDIRAPNLSELFGPTTTGGGGVIDPATGRQLNPQQLSGSNPLLTPETADTWTGGIVLRPSGFLEGLQVSVDYYDIQVDQAIGTLGGQTVANRCFQGATEFCPLVSRDPVSGEITLIRNVLLNVNSVITRGTDIEAQYKFSMGSAGNLDLRLLGTIVKDLITADSVGETQRAGMTGWRAGTQAGMPDWSGDLLTTWSLDRVSVSMHNKYIPSGLYNNSLVGPNQAGYSITALNSANTNEVSSAFYTDLSGQFKINGDDLVVFAAVNNVFDKEPPTAPSVAGNGNFILFDPIGRSYRLGMRARF
jgi:outer membrane receptor protein involved in Fe transport